MRRDIEVLEKPGDGRACCAIARRPAARDATRAPSKSTTSASRSPRRVGRPTPSRRARSRRRGCATCCWSSIAGRRRWGCSIRTSSPSAAGRWRSITTTSPTGRTYGLRAGFDPTAGMENCGRDTALQDARRLLRRGDEEYSFGPGRQPYKDRFATEMRYAYTFRSYSTRDGQVASCCNGVSRLRKLVFGEGFD